jgi:hypothetical protein
MRINCDPVRVSMLEREHARLVVALQKCVDAESEHEAWEARETARRLLKRRKV